MNGSKNVKGISIGVHLSNIKNNFERELGFHFIDAHFLFLFVNFTSAVMKGGITMMFGNFDISKDENNSRFVILCKEQDEKGNECWRSLIFTEEEAKIIHEYLGKNLC